MGRLKGPARALDRWRGLAVITRVGRRVHDAHGHQQLALGRELAHGVIAVIGAEDRAVGMNTDAVRAVSEIAFAPGAYEIAFLVVNDHRVFAAADEIHAVLAVDGHPRHVAVSVALGQLLPSLDDGILDLV